MRYLGTHVSTVGGVSQAPLRAAEIPVNAIQFFAKNNNQWLVKAMPSAAEADAYLSNCESCGVKVAFSHAGYLINLASSDPKNGPLSVESLMQEMELARLLRLDFVVLHPGAHVGQGVPVGISRIAENINRILEKFSGIKTKLLLETTAGQGTCIGHTFEQLAAILEKIEARDMMGICLDTAHVFAAGFDIRTREGYEKMWRDFDKIIGLKNLKAMHLNDSKTPLGSRVDRHEHIGLGQIGDAGFKMLMQDTRFEKTPMALETPKGDDFVKWDRMNLEKLSSFCQR
ncbi:MAG: deoxyribonuclease IV [Deltaproteobacteria bacterium]|nr:deoxyribonuclease IV [Deltaproteobacteria bacterium]